MDHAFELTWMDPKSPARLRRKPEWREFLCSAERPAASAPALANQPAPADDRRDVAEVLARARVTDAAGLRAAVLGAVQPDGRFLPPLLVVEGELELDFDELDRLRALAANALGLASGDEPLLAAIDAAVAFTEQPDLLPTPRAVEAHARNVREAFARVPRGLAKGQFEADTSAGLLAQRSYRTQAFRGAPHVRSSLDLAGFRWLAFVPVPAANRFPLVARFPARLVVEVHRLADADEQEPHALGVLALARRLCVTRPSS